MNLDFIKSPLGLALLAITFSLSGSWMGDKLGIARESSAQTVRVDSLEKRITQIQEELSDYQHGALTANEFSEFRTANDKRLDDIHEDIKELTTDVRAARGLARP
jgi:hypothetical protein